MSKWEIARLGDVSKVMAGQGAPQGEDKYCDDGTPFIKAGNLEDLVKGKNEFELQKVDEVVAKKHNLKLFSAGTIVFAKSGMSCMKSHIYVLKNNCFVVNHLACVIPQNIHPSFLKYYLMFNKPKELIKDSAYPSISLADISLIKIPHPPLEIQKQIAKTLDIAAELIAMRKQQLVELDNLIKSIFYDMFGNPVKNEKGWVKKLWGEVFDTTTGRLDANAMCEDGLYPFFTCSKEAYRINNFAFDCEALLLAGNNATANYDVKYYNGKFNAYQRTYVITLKDYRNEYLLFKYLLEQKLTHMQSNSKGTNTKLSLPR